MSRHKAMKGIIEDSYYDEMDYDDEYGEEEQKVKKDKKKKKPKNQVDEEKAKQIFDGFQGQVTLEQAKQTLIANKNDKDKSIKDLQYQLDQLKKKNKESIKVSVQQKIQKQEEEKKEEIVKKQEEEKLEIKMNKKIQKEEEEEMVDHKILNQIYPDIHYADIKGAPAEENRINLVIIGHVDSGKSTLTGHIIYKLGYVDKQEMHKLEKLSEQMGKASFKFAYLMDQEGEERQRGVTIDVGTCFFETKNRQFAILDAPGHTDFVPNMIMGASQADCAILVIDPNTTEWDIGFGEVGGGKEHAILARSLGVTQILVAVNKLDTLEWSQERYEHIKEKVNPYLISIGFRQENINFVPLSAFFGVNLVEKPTDTPELTSWYQGKTLIEYLDEFKLPKRNSNKPLRICVYDQYKSSEGNIIGDCVQAKVESGIVKEKDQLLLMPLNCIATVKGIEVSKKKVQSAHPGDICEISISIPSSVDPNYIKSGNVLCDIKYPIHQIRELRAQIVVFDITIPITRGQPVLVFSFSTKIPGKIAKLEAIVNPKSGETIKANPKCLTKNQSAIVYIKLDERACLELFSNYKSLGRITLRDRNQTLASGIIIELCNPGHSNHSSGNLFQQKSVDFIKKQSSTSSQYSH